MNLYLLQAMERLQDLFSNLSFFLSQLLSSFFEFLSIYCEGQRQYVMANFSSPLSPGYVCLYLFFVLQLSLKACSELQKKFSKK